MNARMTMIVAAIAGLILVAIDIWIYLSRTQDMAAINGARLVAAMAFQAVGVTGITALVQPNHAPLRRFLLDTNPTFPWAMALGGVVFGIGLAVGALHYGDCSRWDFKRGVLCTA